MVFLTPASFSNLPYVIPNQDQNEEAITKFIADTEADILPTMLGLKFYEALVGAVAPLPARWVALIDGAAYQHNGHKCKWGGLKTFLIPYVYSLWLTANVDAWTETGNEVANTENATVASPLLKVTCAWNDAASKVGATTTAWCGLNPVNTLYGFLLNSGTTYDVDVVSDGWSSFQEYLSSNYKNIGKKNTFGF